MILLFFKFTCSKDLKDSGVLVNACCPGWVRTRMGGDEATYSPEEGAITPVWLCLLASDGPTGKFFAEKKEIPW